MRELRAKKSTGLDDFFKDYTPQQLEEIKRIQDSSQVKDLFHRYAQLLEYHNLEYEQTYAIGWEKLDLFAERTAGLISDVLTPENINATLQITLPYEAVFGYEFVTGMFITRLIQNSYDAGHNAFALNVSNLPELSDVAYRLSGTPERKLELTIHGNLESFGRKARYCSFVSQGNGGLAYGFGALGCRFEIYGDCVNPGWDVCESEFLLHDTIEVFDKKFQQITNSTTQDSIFKTTRKDTLAKLRKSIPQNKGNTIWFIDAKGKEHLKRKT